MVAEREKEKRHKNKEGCHNICEQPSLLKARQLYNRRAFTLHILDNDHIFQTYDPLLHNRQNLYS